MLTLASASIRQRRTFTAVAKQYAIIGMETLIHYAENSREAVQMNIMITSSNHYLPV